LTRKTEVLGENLPQRRFVHHKCHMTRPGFEHGPPRWETTVMVIVEKLVERRLARETEVLGENLPQRHFVHHKCHMTRPWFEHGPPRWKVTVMVIVDKLVELRLAGETEVLGENLSERHFVHHKCHITKPGFEHGPPRREASD
jgi:phage-related protein